MHSSTSDIRPSNITYEEDVCDINKNLNIQVSNTHHFHEPRKTKKLNNRYLKLNYTLQKVSS